MWLTRIPGTKKSSKAPASRGNNGRSGERAGGRHTRTGCSTCKIRHVKCDEERPACYQCRRTGRVCDGYISSSPDATNQTDTDIAVKFLQLQTSMVVGIDHKIAGSTHERRSFEFFTCGIGEDMKNAFNNTYTYQLILQASQSNNAIKHAIVAVGSLGEHLIENKAPFVQVEGEDERLVFARLQYVMAVRHLQDCISRPDAQRVEVILACCFLLTIFDFLSGDDSMARVHLKAGLNILHRCYSETEQTQMSNPAFDFHESHSLVHDLFRIFSVMDLHESIWLGLAHHCPRPLTSPHSLGAEPPQINALNPTIDDISTLLNHHLVRGNILRHSIVINKSHQNDNAMSFYILDEKRRILHGLHEWHMMVERYLSSKTESAGKSFMNRRISLMKMNYHSTLLNLSTCLSTLASPPFLISDTAKHVGPTPTTMTIITQSTLSPPSSNTGFTEILSLAHTLLHLTTPTNRAALLDIVAANAGEFPSTSNDSCAGKNSIPIFAFVSGAIQPLYLVATQCPDLSMCETAIRMLEEAPWREGAWDGAVMARIARRRLSERMGGVVGIVEAM